MKQDAFIQQLRHELRSLPKEAVDEIVADYREYIGDAIAAGRNEEDVIAALGDPARLARELKAQANYRRWEKRRSFGNLMRVVGSIAGLGLLHLVLLVPFMLYMLVLTAGYIASGALTVTGLVALALFGSHALLGKPAETAPFSIHLFDGSAGDAKHRDARHGTLTLDDIDALKVVGDRYRLMLDDGTRISIVTSAGPIVLRVQDDKPVIDTPSEAARKLLTPDGDTAFTIARRDVISLELHTDDGDRVSLARTGRDNPSTIWSIAGDDGKTASFTEDEHGKTTGAAVHDGPASVAIENGQIAIDTANQHVHIVASDINALSGYSSRASLAMLPIGIAGLLFCIWLTRITWRALARYVRRQIGAISASLGRDASA
ncbi:DUF1700 domain-containing protein [Burkholderia singularis]|uniref:DUF1700 domain-containing protein n=1 Tax=Burkholderia singularis TaxID=1503053 RepID=A0A238H4B7_9BURK|nr:DUF1700 domain-containing protein [Burkholderia singularis]SMG00149.1 FIG00453484: hypothetical protein [Burkholderia singularis]